MLTDRDQQSRVFLNNPKKYFATGRKPQKMLSEKQNKKIPSQDTIQSANNDEELCLLRHLVNETGPKRYC